LKNGGNHALRLDGFLIARPEAALYAAGGWQRASAQGLEPDANIGFCSGFSWR
jgi:hypothetical protein